MITSRSTSRLEAWRQRATLEIIVPAAGAFLAMAAVILLLVANTASQMDLVARQAEEERARNVIDHLKESMAVLTGSYSFSDRAVGGLMTSRAEEEHIQEELGNFIYSTFGWSDIVVLSPQGEVIAEINSDTAGAPQDIAGDYVQAARRFSDRLRSAPEVWTPGAIADLIEVRGELYLSAAAFVHPRNANPLTQAMPSLPVLVSFARVNGPLLSSFFSKFGFGKIRAQKGSGVPAGDAALALTVDNSQTLWLLHWTPKRPGEAIWRSLLPWLLCAFLALGALTCLILWRALVMSDRLRLAVIRTAEAQAAAREKDKFLAMMSHELRTPLNAIIGFSDLMSNETFGAHSRPEYRSFARDILFSGRQLLSIIDDIFIMAKLSGGNYPLEIDALDAGAAAEAAAKPFGGAAAGESQVLLRLPAEPLFVRGDRQALLKVLRVMLSNAIKYSSGGTPVVLDVSGSPDEGGVRFTVKDKGIGIPEDRLIQLGEPFTQVEDAYARSHGGLGLGLAIAQSFVTLMKGSLDIESTEGAGTTATITLPAAVAAAKRKAA
ncbi:MAG: hypothetical protein HXY22_03765 [Alphaproteobacteria bacterium]|nr:hypothetical protein [Alphaproteobacteria bacterium]